MNSGFLKLAALIAALASADANAAQDVEPPVFLGAAEAFCAENFGLQINARVDADVLYWGEVAQDDACDADCVEILAEGVVSAVEVSVVEESDFEALTPGLGAFRFTLSTRDDPRCDRFNALYPSTDTDDSESDASPWDGWFLPEACIGVEEISEVSAVHAYDVEFLEYDVVGGFADEVRERVVDRESGQVLGRNFSVDYSIGRLPTAQGDSVAEVYCRAATTADFIAEVLAPDLIDG